MFTAPAGFKASVINVIYLAANAEKAAAVAYANILKQVGSQTSAALIASIGGVETQHYVVLSLLAKGEVAPGMMAMPGDVVPVSFTTSVGNQTTGLESLADFTFA